MHCRFKNSEWTRKSVIEFGMKYKIQGFEGCNKN